MSVVARAANRILFAGITMTNITVIELDLHRLPDAFCLLGLL
jgi:hypothetical protein